MNRFFPVCDTPLLRAIFLTYFAGFANEPFFRGNRESHM